MRCYTTLLLALALPTAASALALGPPLDPPPTPDTPLGPIGVEGPPGETPPVAAPPLDLVLPEPPEDRGQRPELPDLDLPSAQGPPDSLPLDRVPDLSGVVELPTGADIVLDVAPPFGGSPGRTMSAVPEPGTALLLASGLVALGAQRKRRS